MKTQLIESMRRGQHGAMSAKAIAMLVLVLVPLLVVGFYKGRKAYWDGQVRELCAKDGGIKVYETVKLPADRFDEFGTVKIPVKKSATNRDGYYYENNTQILRGDDPVVRRSHTRIVRSVDGFFVGESISYHRVGGDLPGPWHPSHFACPKPIELDLERKVFVKDEK